MYRSRAVYPPIGKANTHFGVFLLQVTTLFVSAETKYESLAAEAWARKGLATVDLPMDHERQRSSELPLPSE